MRNNMFVFCWFLSNRKGNSEYIYSNLLKCTIVTIFTNAHVHMYISKIAGDNYVISRKSELVPHSLQHVAVLFLQCVGVTLEALGVEMFHRWRLGDAQKKCGSSGKLFNFTVCCLGVMGFSLGLTTDQWWEVQGANSAGFANLVGFSCLTVYHQPLSSKFQKRVAM